MKFTSIFFTASENIFEVYTPKFSTCHPPPSWGKAMIYSKLMADTAYNNPSATVSVIRLDEKHPYLSPPTSYHSSLTINHSSRIGCPVVLVGCNGLYSCIQARTTRDVPRLSLPFGHNVCRYSSETFRCRCIEAAVLAAEGTEAALLDEQVEVLRGKVGGALADGLHL